jgi:hypothetical protein
MTTFQPLDIMACFGSDATSRTISWATASPLAPPRLRIGPSHVAVICEFRGQPVWIESTSQCVHPCLINGHAVTGCQAHQPEVRISDYLAQNGTVDVYRLSPVDRLSARESELLTKILLRHFVGQKVTYDFGGALLSGTRLFKHTRLLPGADLHQLFCSELAAKVLMRLGRLNRDNPTKYNPASLLRQLVREGTVQFERTHRKERAA